MRVNRRYWLSLLSEADLAGEVVLDRDPPDDATRYDVFATANFFNFVPWVAALEEVAQVGNAACEAHDQDLVECLIHSLDAKRFEVTSPRDRASRSTLVFLQPRGDIDATAIAAFLRHHGVDVAQRAGQLRVSPHVHNTRADIDTLVDLLSTHSAGCA
jgi:selenocysteine lyase/cysteine desulfurase